MGRSKKNKKRQESNNNNSNSNNNTKKRKGDNQRGNNNNNKRQRQQRFWIEDCKDSKFPEGTAFQVEVLITRGEVTDDYRQVSQKTAVTAAKTTTADTTTDEKKPKAKDESTKEEPQKDQNSADIAGEDNDDNNTKGSDTATKAKKSVDEKGGTTEKEATESSTVAAKTDTTDPSPEKKPERKPGGLRVSVKRSKSAKRPIRGVFNSVENFKPLPNGDCGDGVTNPFPKEEVPDKFWSQRRRLFTRFDEGIQLDKESWYSITPEAIANHIAGRVTENREKLVVLDLFCGCGGNAIGFALRDEVELVVCVDKDVEKLKKAAKNASIYGVAGEKMVFINGDASNVIDHFEDGRRVKISASESAVEKECGYQLGGLELLPEKLDVVFLSPPWGGMDYVKVGKRNYTLSCIKIESDDGPEVDGEELLKRSSKCVGFNPIVLFLPRNINGVKLGESAIKAGYEGPIILEQNVLNGKLKTVTAYLGL